MKRLIDALNDVLATQQYRWVSVDIFDTLVFRDIAQPEEIAERAYANVANQIPLALTAAEFAELRKGNDVLRQSALLSCAVLRQCSVPCHGTAANPNLLC